MTDSSNISKLVRPNILEMKPYASARDEFTGTASVFLDANENPFNEPLNRYPDPRQQQLKKRIAELKAIAMENIFLGNGSDEGIDLLFRVFCEPGMDHVITVDPTYGMYAVCAEINGVKRRSVLLKSDFSLDPDAVLAAVDAHTKLIFMCSPNNPTSNSFDREAMLKIVDGVDCLVVVDEAYIDFSRDPGLLSMLNKKWNLVLLQTLSKSWGLAGIRLGMLFARAELIEYVSRVKYPYNVNSLSLETARKALDETARSRRWIQEILDERARLGSILETLPCIQQVFPSDANFLLVKVDKPAAVYDFLMHKGIIIRDRSGQPLCRGCLRITIGTPEENRALVAALKTYES